MLGAFGAYIKTITALTIFSAMVCILLPDGSSRKYVELVLGIMILTAVLGPMIKLFHLSDAQVGWDGFRRVVEAEHIMPAAECYTQAERQSLERAYSHVLEKRIEEDMRQVFDDISWIQVDIQGGDYGDFGEIKELRIACKEEQKDAVMLYVSMRYGLDDGIITAGEITKER